MKTLLNTLFVTLQGAYIHREGETLIVRHENQVRLSVPIHTLGGVVCFGAVTASPFALGMCAENGTTVSFLTENGLFLARVEGPVHGNVLLRREQYRRADCPLSSAAIARSVLIGKLVNSRQVILRAARDHGNAETTPMLEQAAARISRLTEKLDQPIPLDQLRGREGEAADVYFSVFDNFIVAQKEHFQFTKRSRRPPLDPINALLGFLYTLLTHDIRGACEAAGLDPQVGFLHRDRPGRPSLALDIMEEFRPLLADRLALTLINRQQIKPKDFRQQDSGAVLLTDDARKTVLTAWQERKREEITHPFLGEKTAIGLLPYIQAQLLARYLRGDHDAYPAFIWK
jgi:CRISPR-associated protein Cas1